MQRQMLKSKIHRATITDCDVDYVGSITLDPEPMQVIVASFGVLADGNPDQGALL